MSKWKCSICGYIHDEATDGPFSAQSADWVCPWCKAAQSAFVQEGGAPAAAASVDTSLLEGDEKELTALELSAICSNLAKGCTKQYLSKEAELFTTLATQLKENAVPATGSMDDLLALVQQDLDQIAPLVQAVASEKKDRGALRAYTWNTKVTTLLKSLLEQYQAVGDAMLQNTNVYVCTICGFVYVGDAAPTLCPVCKVQSDKFEEIGGI